MKKYTVLIAKSVQKQIDKLPANIRTRVDAKIQQLSDEPRPAGSIKLKGSDNQYRIRVGDYRIRYSVHDETVLVQILQCGHRRDIYKDKG